MAEDDPIGTHPPPRDEDLQRAKNGESRFVREMIAIRYEAPLPPPGMMAQYERILPGSADRIVSMAERQSSHRQQLEGGKLASDISNERLGQVFAFILALIGLAGGLALAWQGKSIVGLTAFITTLASLVGLFIYGRRRQETERSKKLERLLDAAEKKLLPPSEKDDPTKQDS